MIRAEPGYSAAMRFAALSVVTVLGCGGGRSQQDSSPPSTSNPDTTAPIVDDERACTADADCVLTEYQSGCCAQACEPYAINKTVIDKRIEQERGKCDAQRASGAPCPPPADCPLPTHTVVGVRCANNTCETVTKPGFGKP